MHIWEIVLIGVALAMDAVAVGMTDGMQEPFMKKGKMLMIALAFGFFQFAMPVLGYLGGYAFSDAISRIVPYLSFAILSFLGGKAIVDCVKEDRGHGAPVFAQGCKLTAGKLLGQAIATSLDALAVGITLLAAEKDIGLPAHAAVCATVIGAVTFILVLPAVMLGKKAAEKIAGRAEILGGAVLIAIGLKLLLEGVV